MRALWGLWDKTARALPAGMSATLWRTQGQVGQRGYKVVSALRRRCSDCRIVKRGKKVYVQCNEHPRHKQRQGKGGAKFRQN